VGRAPVHASPNLFLFLFSRDNVSRAAFLSSFPLPIYPNINTNSRTMLLLRASSLFFLLAQAIALPAKSSFDIDDISAVSEGPTFDTLLSIATKPTTPKLEAESIRQQIYNILIAASQVQQQRHESSQPRLKRIINATPQDIKNKLQNLFASIAAVGRTRTVRNLYFILSSQPNSNSKHYIFRTFTILDILYSLAKHKRRLKSVPCKSDSS